MWRSSLARPHRKFAVTRVVAFVEDMKQADLKQLAERHQHYFAEAGPAFKVWCAAMRKDRVWADLDFAVFF